MQQPQHMPRFGDQEWKLAYSVALRVLKSADWAEDAAQEALLRAYRARESYSGRARFSSWLYRIAFTTALSHLRKPHIRRRLQPAASTDHPNPLDRMPSEDQPSDELTAASELAHCVQGCLSKLRPLDQVAFTERYLRGTTERELGELLGVSTNAAKQRAFRARRAIRQCVSAAGMNPRENQS